MPCGIRLMSDDARACGDADVCMVLVLVARKAMQHALNS
jgi:hypothetical protein